MFKFQSIKKMYKCMFTKFTYRKTHEMKHTNQAVSGN